MGFDCLGTLERARETMGPIKGTLCNNIREAQTDTPGLNGSAPWRETLVGNSDASAE